jgi:hypothetical protein
LGFVATKWSTEKRLHKFEKDWNNTIKVMRAIAARGAAPDVKPRWIDGSVAIGVQVDQFLHACYYKQAKNGNRYPFEEFFVRNSKIPSWSFERPWIGGMKPISTTRSRNARSTNDHHDYTNFFQKIEFLS